MSGKPVTIRMRSLSGYRRETGGYTGWDEWQVVQGLKILHRADLRAQAEKWARENGFEIKATSGTKDHQL